MHGQLKWQITHLVEFLGTLHKQGKVFGGLYSLHSNIFSSPFKAQLKLLAIEYSDLKQTCSGN